MQIRAQCSPTLRSTQKTRQKCVLIYIFDSDLVYRMQLMIIKG